LIGRELCPIFLYLVYNLACIIHEMKKILIVSYHFPPDAAVGAIRIAKFAKYLPGFRWTPFVLTAEEKYYDFTDQSRMSEIIAPDNIFRTSVWPDSSVLYLRIKRWLYRTIDREKLFEENENSYRGPDRVETGGRLRRLRRLLLSLLAVVDDILGWVPPAILKALLIMRRHSIDCLYTSGPPHSAHIIGFVLKMLYGTRWVVDFRDPLILNPSIYNHSKKTKLSNAIEKWMERQIVTHADKVISVTKKMSQAFVELYPEMKKEKFETIPNGYDPDDFIGLPGPLANSKFRISYIGTFYRERTPSDFLIAVRELIAELKIPRQDVEIQFIGPSHYSNGRSIEEMVRREGLASETKLLDSLPYKEALREMAASHVLLLLATNQYYQIPAKTFEYLASGADIIALTSEGATADLLGEIGWGFVVEPNSRKEIKDAIETCYEKYEAGNCQSNQRMPSQQFLLRYSRKQLTKNLASLLDSGSYQDQTLLRR